MSAAAGQDRLRHAAIGRAKPMSAAPEQSLRLKLLSVAREAGNLWKAPNVYLEQSYKLLQIYSPGRL
jgi:hypothetical protein